MFEELKKCLDDNAQVRKALFAKGFVITNSSVSIDIKEFPFYDNWRIERIRNIQFIINNDLSFHYTEKDGRVLFLLGHAYNPFDFEKEECFILRQLIEQRSANDFWKYEADLTGVYVLGYIDENGLVYHWSDCAGMRISYYGIIHGYYYITSHVNILAYLFDLREDEYITELKTYRFFHYFGNVLPGDYSPFKELKRTVPNHCYCSNGNMFRFYPFEPIAECKSEADYNQVLLESSQLLKNTLNLCAKKWPQKQAAISVTGGKDSGVTLSSASDVYDSFCYFSYISKPEEAVDSHAAGEICKKLGLLHREIRIPDKNNEIEDINILKEIIYVNGGSVGYPNENEIRKRNVLINDRCYSLEVKSWVNEITRAYWHKKYSKKRFPKKPTGKYLATLYKLFLNNRNLFKKTARVFDNYINKYMRKEDCNYFSDWLVLWSWEFGFSAGEGQHLISEHLLSWDITIPFNNRHLISIMLKPKIADRIADRLQTDIIKLNNPIQASMNINIVNAAHTHKRAIAEKIYLAVNSHLPF